MSRRGIVLIAATVLAGALALTLPSLFSRGGGLEWTGAPQVYRVPGLNTDRILAGHVVNASNDAVYVDARRIYVVDPGGHRFETGARFLASFVHPLYAPMQFHTAGDASELQRLGIAVRIEPGQSLPLTVSWRAGPGASSPSSVDLGVGSLPIPAG